MTLKHQTSTLFITCLVDALFPDIAQSVINVLEAQGIQVQVPAGQTCCGQPAFNAGYWDDARKMARHTLDILADGDEPIVLPSGSCGAMLSQRYVDLFADEPDYLLKAKSVAIRTMEFTQHLVDYLQITNLGAVFPARIAYHPSCHTLREMKIDHQPRQLLANVRELKIVEQANPETCCGFGGTFAVTMGDISGKMLQNRLDAFTEIDIDYIVGCDISCLMNIEGGLRKQGSTIRTLHIAQLLAEGIQNAN